MKRARKRTEVAPGQKKNPAEAGFSIVRNRCATRGSILRRLDVELEDQRRKEGISVVTVVVVVVVPVEP